jgi:putative oxidoreductase
MKRIAQPLPRGLTKSVVIRLQPRLDSKLRGVVFFPVVSRLDERLLELLQRWSIPVLRVALGLLFIWFGALKTLGVSPVIVLIRETYTFLPLHLFVLVLGGWEMLIGIGMILKRALRCVLILLGMHLAGTFVALWLNPRHFFVQGIPLFLTGDGEFVMKNLVLMAAGLVIAGYEVRPFRKKQDYNESVRLMTQKVDYLNSKDLN